MTVVAIGLTVVLVDFRTESLDLVPDPIGWLLVAAGVAVLGLHLAAWLAALASLLSVSEAFLPYRYLWVDPDTNKVSSICRAGTCAERIVFDPVHGWRLVAAAATVVAGGASVWVITSGLRRRALESGDHASRRRLGLVCWAAMVLWVAPPAIAMLWAVMHDQGRYDNIWNGGAEYAALIGSVALVGFIVELSVRSGASWAVPMSRQRPSPWATEQHGP